VHADAFAHALTYDPSGIGHPSIAVVELWSAHRAESGLVAAVLESQAKATFFFAQMEP
jgi:hypothetical protein